MGNEHLQRAMKNKNDEFYTLYEDVRKGLESMMKLLEGKRIEYCCLVTMKKVSSIIFFKRK